MNTVCLHESGSRWIKVNLCINTRQLFTPRVQRWGGFTWSSCVESGPRALFPTDLLPYNNNHNPRPDQTQKNPRSALQISWADACGWCDTAREAQTSYSPALSTSVPSYGRHFTPSKPSCLGICLVGMEQVWSRLCYVGRGLKIIFEDSVLLCVWEHGTACVC